jgi:hypothetical protein
VNSQTQANFRVEEDSVTREPNGFPVDPPTEPFIGAAEAATFIKLHRKTLLRFAREGLIPAHPITGDRRRRWIFLISELDAWARAKVHSGSDPCRNLRRK